MARPVRTRSPSYGAMLVAAKGARVSALVGPFRGVRRPGRGTGDRWVSWRATISFFFFYSAGARNSRRCDRRAGDGTARCDRPGPRRDGHRGRRPRAQTSAIVAAAGAPGALHGRSGPRGGGRASFVRPSPGTRLIGPRPLAVFTCPEGLLPGHGPVRRSDGGHVRGTLVDPGPWCKPGLWWTVGAWGAPLGRGCLRGILLSHGTGAWRWSAFRDVSRTGGSRLAGREPWRWSRSWFVRVLFWPLFCNLWGAAGAAGASQEGDALGRSPCAGGGFSARCVRRTVAGIRRSGCGGPGAGRPASVGRLGGFPLVSRHGPGTWTFGRPPGRGRFGAPRGREADAASVGRGGTLAPRPG